MMNKNEILERAKKEAARIAKDRKDPRYTKTLGFLVAKGFLFTNQKLPLEPNARLKIEDAIWAGQNVEPRILEVLPAAVIRLEKHFDFHPEKHTELKNAIELLLADEDGIFNGIPLEKIKPWLNLKLKDGRVKKLADKKIMKTFRLRPETVEKIIALKKVTGQTETEIIEKLVAGVNINKIGNDINNKSPVPL
jgi:hypothetical protein